MTDIERAQHCLGELAPWRYHEYEAWLQVGMVLHHVGVPVSVWDHWSQQSMKYKPGCCEEKWRTFGHNGSPLTMGSLYEMVRQDGGRLPPVNGGGHELAWDSEIEVQLRPEPRPAAPFAQTDPGRELANYLEAVFKPGEVVGYVTESYEREGKWLPASRGTYVRTAGELAAEARAKGADYALCCTPGPGGAWIRLNPLDGKGVKDENVVEFRHVLVESDTLSKPEQLALIRRLRLPCSAVVDSGGKSVHAVVRIDAGKDRQLYRERVEFLFERLAREGLQVDRANRNPSRLSRVPGVARGEARQALLSLQQGCASWDEWHDWLQVSEDTLPPFTDLSTVFHDPPPRAPEIIGGVLRQGHKLMLSGPSKAGKSYALLQLAVAFAEGSRWIAWDCAQGDVLYVNLELDGPSCIHRFTAIYQALGLEPRNLDRISIWNLRGHVKPLDELVPILINRMQSRNYVAVIVDPIYKLLTGDENSASDMAYFCNQLDRLAHGGQTAVIVASHFAKGFAGDKRAMDRTSGSGVFARDPDAIITMTELEQEDDDCPAYRLEFILREFRAPEHVSCWFRHPLHVYDGQGALAGSELAGASASKSRGRPTEVTPAMLLKAIQDCSYAGGDGPAPSVEEVATRLDCSNRTIYRGLNKLKDWTVRSGRIIHEPMNVQGVN